MLPNEVDKKTSNMMVDMWANFATYGKPIPSPHEMLEGGKKMLGSLVSYLFGSRGELSIESIFLLLYFYNNLFYLFFSQVSNDTLVKSPRKIWKSVENIPDGGGGANYIRIINDLIVFFNDPHYDKRMEFWKKLLG